MACQKERLYQALRLCAASQEAEAKANMPPTIQLLFFFFPDISPFHISVHTDS